LLIAGGSLAFGLLVLLPHLQGWQCGLIVLGICVVGFAAVFVWNRLFPPPFNIDPHHTQIDYEFRDRRLCEEFAQLNGATEEA
jgi:hypothetical protein